MVRNAEPHGVVDRVRYAFFGLQSLSRGEALEALYAGRPVPGCRRRPSSRAMLVFPILRCPVKRMWLRFRTWDSRTRSSGSRSKKSSPLTQRPAVGLMAVFPLVWFVDEKENTQRFRCQRYRCVIDFEGVTDSSMSQAREPEPWTGCSVSLKQPTSESSDRNWREQDEKTADRDCGTRRERVCGSVPGGGCRQPRRFRDRSAVEPRRGLGPFLRDGLQ